MRDGAALNDRVITEELQRLIALAGRSDAPVLIHGEPGSDKEVVARLLHTQSRRAGGPFIVVDCGGAGGKSVETELFGYWTDVLGAAAAANPGLIAAAERGTLFFQELNDIPGPIQIRLSKFLDQGAYQAAGSKRMLHADVRIVGATTQDLQARVLQGRFSDDLLYRISAVTLRVPRWGSV
ncbi:MAG TPA: sigma 54-interacting transcriptional regulator [Nitrospiraceae bacterium]|nr:sigma 54-interacting transcriptional regulator [Nitrospiraceae bacterium]